MPDARTPTRPVLLPLPLGRTLRGVIIGNAAGLAVAGIAAAIAASTLQGADVFWESGPIEWLQIVCWIVALWAAGYAIVRAPTRRDVWNASWLAVLAALAIARELDLHETIDADHWKGYGVSFMLNWWTDPAVYWLRKAVWAVVFGVIGLGLAVPPLVVHAPGWRLLRRGDPGVWLIAVGVVWLAFGYAADDLLGRNQFVHERMSRAVEEAAELVGVGFIMCSLIYTTIEPLSRRIARLDAQTPADDEAEAGARSGKGDAGS
jgi:hypothetical protein